MKVIALEADHVRPPQGMTLRCLPDVRRNVRKCVAKKSERFAHVLESVMFKKLKVAQSKGLLWDTFLAFCSVYQNGLPMRT